jgi:hypothetical protein
MNSQERIQAMLLAWEIVQRGTTASRHDIDQLLEDFCRVYKQISATIAND